MKKLRIMIQSEDAQARLVVAGFFIMFALLALLSS